MWQKREIRSSLVQPAVGENVHRQRVARITTGEKRMLAICQEKHEGTGAVQFTKAEGLSVDRLADSAPSPAVCQHTIVISKAPVFIAIIPLPALQRFLLANTLGNSPLLKQLTVLHVPIVLLRQHIHQS